MNLPSTLVQRVKKGQVLPFVGAGVSMAVRSVSDNSPLFPSWKELLIRAADKLAKENKETYSSLVKGLISIDRPDFQRAAEYAKSELGPLWFDFLKDQFDRNQEDALDSSLDLARAVWNLNSKLVVTTNYDRVLHWACESQADVRTWNIEAPVEQAAAIRDGVESRTIWHLHGKIDDAIHLILTPDGYERLYPSEAAKTKLTAALETLRSLLVSKSFLFLGFSLSDNSFGMQLKGVSEIFAGANGPHYALVRKGSIEGIRAKTENTNIEFIEYDHDRETLDFLLQKLTSNEIPPEQPAISEKTLITVVTTNTGATESEFTDSCDTPPPIVTWVGRTEELDLMRRSDGKVIAITGIGGQGKSTLATKYLSDSKAEFFWDWRDCKEENFTLHTQIVLLIERLTKGKRKASELTEENTESVIRLFLQLTTTVRGIFVFDNIDQYVDALRACAVGPMHFLINQAMKSATFSKFIFTARPRLHYDNQQFLHIELAGLTKDEARELFTARGLHSDTKHIDEMHELTQGHPLWISLIARQVLNNRVSLPELIAKIRTGKDAGLPSAMLGEIWKSLTPKQHKLLRYLAEIVRPETEKQICQFVSRELKQNQFNKVLRQLRLLDLVVVKSPPNSPDTIELHPLLREFVRRQFSRSERVPYISDIIVFIDRYIVMFRPSLNNGASFDALQNWTAKTELLINSGKYDEALLVLNESRISLLESGYPEEFVRLASSLFSNWELSDSVNAEQRIYEDVYTELVIVLTQLGRFLEADEHIERFASSVGNATASYVAVCSMRCYSYWFRGEYRLAQEWGQRGVDLKTRSNLDTRHDCAHDLALSQRDSGNIQPALKFFLGASDLTDIKDPKKIDTGRGGSFYGNIGRCLYFLSDLRAAEVCLIKSAWLLEKDVNRLSLLNQGWAAMWLGEIYKPHDTRRAYICFRRAFLKWNTISPPRAEQAQEAARKIEKDISPKDARLQDWEIDRNYTTWINEIRQFPGT